MSDLLTATEKRDLALRCHNALVQATAFGAKLGTHPQTLRLWIDGTKTMMHIVQQAEDEILKPRKD